MTLIGTLPILARRSLVLDPTPFQFRLQAVIYAYASKSATNREVTANQAQ